MIYFEAIDSIVSAIKERFEQPSFNILLDVEQLLLKSINGEDYKHGDIFRDDIDPSALPSELSIITTTYLQRWKSSSF